MFNEEIQRDLKQQQSKKNTDTRNKHLTFIWSRLPRVVEVTQIYGILLPTLSLLFHFQTQLQVTLSSSSQGYDHRDMFHNYTSDKKVDQSFTCLTHYFHPKICIL